VTKRDENVTKRDQTLPRSHTPQILDVLEYFEHRSPQVVHRDIKPSNLLLDLRIAGVTSVTLVDFGAVTTVDLANADKPQGSGDTTVNYESKQPSYTHIATLRATLEIFVSL
jgi:serine/threonine protein kinase